MKINLKELRECLKHIEANSFDMSILLREDGKGIKITVASKTGSLIDYDIYDEELSIHARVRESRELCLK